METNHLNTAEAIVYFISLWDTYSKDLDGSEAHDCEAYAFCVCQKIRNARKQSWAKYELRQLMQQVCCTNNEQWEELYAITNHYFAGDGQD